MSYKLAVRGFTEIKFFSGYRGFPVPADENEHRICYWFVYYVYLIFIVLCLFINVFFMLISKMQSIFGSRV